MEINFPETTTRICLKIAFISLIEPSIIAYKVNTKIIQFKRESMLALTMLPIYYKHIPVYHIQRWIINQLIPILYTKKCNKPSEVGLEFCTILHSKTSTVQTVLPDTITISDNLTTLINLIILMILWYQTGVLRDF